MKKVKEIQDDILSSLDEIEKEFGKGSVMLFGANNQKEIQTISTGSLTLNKALGIGGYPYGRVVEIFGSESTGKTTLALHAIAEVQKTGGRAAFIDAEHAIDPNYCKKLGIDLDRLILSQPDSGEQALNICEALIKTEKISLIVIDSVAALVPEAELNGEMGDQLMGAHARLMSKGLRKISALISKTNCVVIFINQIREKIGVMFGNPQTTTGGRALKFFSTLRLEIKRQEVIKKNNESTGIVIKVVVIKNKLASPFQQATFEIRFGEGINSAAEVIDLATEYDIIKKSGSWYSFKDEKIGQGREAIMDLFKEKPEIKEEITKEVMSKLFPEQ